MFREAVEADLQAIVDLLADDPLGRQRESPGPPLPAAYLDAFRAIDGDPRHELWVADLDGAVVGILQVSFLPNLSRLGAWRALVEGVRIAASQRGRGLGQRLLERAEERARAWSCVLIQLTTDKTRPAAKRFYESLGYAPSHEGMKKPL